MVQNILPAIRKLHGNGKKKLNFTPACQQDGAGGHGTKTHSSWQIEQDAANNKPEIDFHTQPANSPCLNLCDLGLWPMIQEHVVKMQPKTTDDLWKYMIVVYCARAQSLLCERLYFYVGIFDCPASNTGLLLSISGLLELSVFHNTFSPIEIGASRDTLTQYCLATYFL